MDFCPDYVEAVRLEQRQRSAAFVGEREKICGIPVVQISAFIIELLLARGNPILAGGKVTCGSILHFLWIVSEHFDPVYNLGCEEFCDKHGLTLNYVEAQEQIDAYLKRTFMDAPYGPESTPYYAVAAWLCREMRHFGWSVEKTLHSPIRVTYQLIRADAHSKGATLYNKTSDRVMGDALDELQKKMDSGEATQADFDRMNGVPARQEAI